MKVFKFNYFMALLLLTPLFACNGGGDEGDDDTTTEEEEWSELTTPVTGDFSCLGSNADPTPTGALINIIGEIIDFEEDNPVEGGYIDIFFDNRISSTPDASAGPTGSDGMFTVTDVPAQSFFAYHVWTEVDPPETKDSYEFNVLTPDIADGETWEEEFTSVSVQTYMLITTILGISPDPEKAVVAGTFKDCNGDPVEFGGATIVDEDGNEPEGIKVRYFLEEFPDRTQPYTSADGLWAIIDVPEGHWTVQLWGILEEGQEPQLLAYNDLDTFSDSVCITNVWPR